MKIRVTIALLLVGAALSITKVGAQSMGVKTNLLYWGTTTPNLGVEFGLGKRTTIDLSGTYNPWSFGTKNSKLKHWTAQSEIRFWNCERFNKGFWGIHVTGGEFNAGNIKLPLGVFEGLKDFRYQGWMMGGGISYGHQWYLGPRWNLEATFGFGYLYLEYNRYDCEFCGSVRGKETKHYFGPTKIGVSFIYLFNFKNNKKR